MSERPDFLFGKMNHFHERLARQQAEWPGLRHEMRCTPTNPEPGQPITLTVLSAGQQAYQELRCWYTLDGSRPTMASPSLPLRQSGAEWSLLEWDYRAVWEVELPGQPAGTLLRYRLGGHDLGSDRWRFADNESETIANATPFALLIGAADRPAWAHEAIVYQIFLDRFYPGDGLEWRHPGTISGIYGGTLRGAIQKLDYIRDLGCNAIWLSPVFASPSHHRYDAYDYYTIDPVLGSNEDFLELIEQAHARGIRVIMDFVANHWSHLHGTMQEAQKDRHSPYYDWYYWIDWPHDYHTFFGVMTMPKLNLEHEPARQYLYECAQHWLRQGVDGFRLDHAHGPSIDFWAGFRQACRSVKPDCWLFAEVTEGAEKNRGYSNAMDGLCDFLLTGALRQTFAQEAWSLGQFENFLRNNNGYMTPHMMMPAFLDNHDMNRFLYAAGDDKAKLRLAALVLLTLPGPPILYNGTESGENQERSIHNNDFGIYEEARLPMRWDERFDSDLWGYFQRLLAIRRAHPVIWQGEREAVWLDEAAGGWGYVWRRPAGPAQLLVLVNRSRHAQTISLANPGFGEAVRDLLGDRPVICAEGRLLLTLPSQTGAILAAG
ncbi:MAG: hypothetical protein KDE09_10380 [Anaerolineales bacterium]|nr:hypothetical protein [Anaerolineales bacterium]